MIFQVCHSTLSAEDLAVDPYVQLCLNCWHVCEIEDGAPLRRYGKPNGKSVCTACGMVFGGVKGFDRHRKSGRCLSPAELRDQNRPLLLKNGIWVKDAVANGLSALPVRDSSHFNEVPATSPLPSHENA
jgi:hypothetical protein